MSYSLPDGFSYIDECVPYVIIEMRYATTHNFTSNIVDGYEANRAILTNEACAALVNAAKEFYAMGYRIKVYDAYRPQRAVRAFVNWAKDPNETSSQAEFYPEIKNKQTLLDLQYIARNSNHCKGSALDITLTDLDGNELDMGTCFDYFGKKAWHGASGLTGEQEQNRLLLRGVMEKYGFKAFEREWWHYRLLHQPYNKNFDFVVK